MAFILLLRRIAQTAQSSRFCSLAHHLWRTPVSQTIAIGQEIPGHFFFASELNCRIQKSFCLFTISQQTKINKEAAFLRHMEGVAIRTGSHIELRRLIIKENQNRRQSLSLKMIAHHRERPGRSCFAATVDVQATLGSELRQTLLPGRFLFTGRTGISQ